MIEKLNDDILENVSGGMTANLKAAYACINGDYGNGEARFAALRRAGFDPNVVQGLVNDLLKYEKVAKDVIDGKYGNGEARRSLWPAPATTTTPSRTWSTTCCC